MILKNKTKETFDQLSELSYFVIHMSSKTERKENIKKQEERLGKPIQHFESIVGKDYINSNLNELNPDIINHWGKDRSSGELGCYLSHLMLLKQIADKSTDGYSIIFEDDFDIVVPNLDEKIKGYVESLRNDNRDFDLIFLGRCCWNNGSEYKEELREIKNLNDDVVIMCTHAYVIKNSSAKKFYEYLLDVEIALDHIYNKIIKEGKMKAYTIDPPIVNQQNDIFESDIVHTM
jgi:glycosyl transferase family 25